jgi:predicted DCC family thiol-disulfide oxidoreductase YuxK
VLEGRSKVLALTWRLLLDGKKGERERGQFVENEGVGVGSSAVFAAGASGEEVNRGTYRLLGAREEVKWRRRRRLWKAVEGLRYRECGKTSSAFLISSKTKQRSSEAAH